MDKRCARAGLVTIVALMVTAVAAFAQTGVAPYEVQLDKPSVLLTVREASALKLLVNPAGRRVETEYSGAMSWTSADQSVATVDARGVVTGKGLGRTTVTATSPDGRIVKTCRVTVIKDKKKVSIEAMESGWVNAPQPPPDQDVYKQWIDKTFNVDFRLNASAGFNDQLMVRFAAGNPPDIVLASSRSTILKLYNQSLVIADWNKYLSSIPTIDKTYFTPETRLRLTQDSKLFALPLPSSPQSLGLQIRKDWLKKLNLQMPTTPDELLEAGRQFVRNDLYGRGKNNTIAFTDSNVAAGASGVSNFNAFTIMWGPESWFVTDDGKASHAVVAGFKEKLLQWGRRVLVEGLMDPDWATQKWDERKPKIFDGQIGVIWYPGDAIINETVESGKQADPTEMWTTFDTPPKGGPAGGRYPQGGYYSNVRTVSALAEKDPVKMERILQILETLTTPHEDYYIIREGVQIDGLIRGELPDGTPTCYWNGGLKAMQAKLVHPYQQADDYALFINSGNQIYTPLYDKEIDRIQKYGLDLRAKVWNAPKYPNVGGLLTFDSRDLDGTNKAWAQFYVNYLTGRDSDYQAFVQRWLRSGGQNMIDQANQQLKTLKYIK